MQKAEEFAVKMERVKTFLSDQGLDGAVLGRGDNFAWLGCGADNLVDTTAETGVASLVVLDDGVTLLTNNIEAGRLQAEELHGLGIRRADVYPWHEPHERTNALKKLAARARLAADDGTPGLTPLPAGFCRLRFSLTEAEVDRYRALGADCRDAIESAARAVERGMTEADAAAGLAAECRRRGVLPGVVLVAADERLTSWRHPVPKATPVERCALLVLCGRRQGLVAAVSRLVHFGQFGEDLIRRHMAACTVDARMIWATTPGARAADVLRLGRQTYSEFNFPDEWRLHHQGGAIGYRSREYIATPDCAEVVQPNQAFAWNPSIRGTKSEDTILATAGGPELLTEPAEDWPTVHIEMGGKVLHRADILVK
jgi:Xaa-Pro aminopeptidase